MNSNNNGNKTVFAILNRFFFLISCLQDPNTGEGQYAYAYDTENGIAAQENGQGGQGAQGITGFVFIADVVMKYGF